MTGDTNERALKTITKGVRLTEDMNKLFTVLAKEKGVPVGKYLRDAGLILAEMCLDEKELLDFIKDKDKLKVQKTHHILIQETKDTLINSIGSLHDNLSKRLDRQEKLLELFLYSYFFHTPEVEGPLKEHASRSAKKRKKSVLELVDKVTSKAGEP